MQACRNKAAELGLLVGGRDTNGDRRQKAKAKARAAGMRRLSSAMGAGRRSSMLGVWPEDVEEDITVHDHARRSIAIRGRVSIGEAASATTDDCFIICPDELPQASWERLITAFPRGDFLDGRGSS